MKSVKLPTVSVLLPTYDRAGYLGAAVESVLAQTFGDFELIVVDDGSRDETPRLLASYTDRLRYLRQENKGMAAARNRGIREARGELVGLLDSDDRWEPRLLETVRAAFTRHPEAGAAFVAERSMDGGGNVSARIHSKRTPGPFFTPEGMIGKDTRVGSGRPPLARRDLFDRLGYYDESLGGAWDCEMWIRWSFHTPMVLVPEPLILRRIHPGNFSGDRLRDAEAWLEILARVAREHPDLLRLHGAVYRRALGKNHLRLGRELLARSAADPDRLARARSELRSAIAAYPRFARALTYLAWSYVAPRTFGAWRARTIRNR
jgi:glycosyltransferase involved in cell wall biosynthesis